MNDNFWYFEDWVEGRSESYHCWYGWHWLAQQSHDEMRRIAAGTTAATELTFEQMRQNAVRYIKANVPDPSKPARARGYISKMSTAAYRSRLRDLSGLERNHAGGLKCWEAALDAFGVTRRTGNGEHSHTYRRHLEDEGWEVKPVTWLAPEGVSPTVAVFLAAHTSGDYLVETRGHVIAVRDGVITDTAGQSATVRKRVTAAYELHKKPVLPEPGKVNWPHPGCTCTEPIVWGHEVRCPTGLGRWTART